MKKKICLILTGCVLALTACGSQEVAPAPSEAPAETATEAPAQTAETTAPETAEQTEAAEDTTENATETEEAAPDNFEEEIEYITDDVVKSENASVKIPDEFKGKVLASVDGEGISFYDKETVDGGFPGYVFTIVTTKDSSIMAGGMFKKVGEISTPGGNFNVCLGFASDVQWDYTTHEEMPESYGNILNSADAFVRNVEAVGEGTFVYGGGTKGEDFYTYTVSRYIDAVNEKWDANQFEEADMSPEFFSMTQTDGDPLEKIGYAYIDISHDGVDELLVGEITGTDEPSVIYDIYTIVDGMPAHVVSGTARDRYYALNYGGVANEYSGGANESGINVYEIEPGTADLFKQYSIKYDGYTDEKNPWFVSYSEDEWEPMTEEDYNQRLETVTGDYMKVDFKPISDLAVIDYSKVDLSKYDTFTKMIDDFKPGMGYANVTLGDTDVFLVASGTFPDENNKFYAIDASIFMYGDNGIVYLGKVESQGTANPLAISDGMIFTGGHHVIMKTTVKDGKLVTAERADRNYDESGNETYTTGSEEDGNLKEDKDGAEFNALYDEYFKAEIIDFSAVQ